MKRFKIVSLAITVMIVSGMLSVYSFGHKSARLKPAKVSKNTGFAVVELFTSEGCSSCPAADNAVAKLVSQRLENVYVLCFHVDYWNRLGWVDPFSQSLFSARQNEYARFLSLKSIYTPQVVINGVSQFVGSNENKLNTTIKNDLRTKSKMDIGISAKRNNNVVTVVYNIGENNVVLNLALIQPAATIPVKNGENAGKTLQHVNIVRAFHQADVKGKGTLDIRIPKDLSSIPLKLIAYTQSRKDFTISGADEKDL